MYTRNIIANNPDLDDYDEDEIDDLDIFKRS